jgi:hypothetical protein
MIKRLILGFQIPFEANCFQGLNALVGQLHSLAGILVQFLHSMIERLVIGSQIPFKANCFHGLNALVGQWYTSLLARILVRIPNIGTEFGEGFVVGFRPVGVAIALLYRFNSSISSSNQSARCPCAGVSSSVVGFTTGGGWVGSASATSIACRITGGINNNDGNVIVVVAVIDIVIVRDVGTGVSGTGVTVGASDAVGGNVPPEEESWTGAFVGSAGGALLVGVSSVIEQQ